MVRSAIAIASVGLLVAGTICGKAGAIPPVSTIEWVGGATGEWNNANAWRNTTTGVVGNALTLMGDRYGSEGMNSIDPAVTKARHIVIGGGATVDFAAETANNDMSPRGIRLRQGTTLTIKDGATWVHDVSDIPMQPTGSFECRCDPSSLILDGGTFRRTGTFSPEGGGNAIFGSYNDDNNQQRLGTNPPIVNIVITNGGRLENEGQLWFGTEGESSPRSRTSVTINNGHMDLTGGEFPIENSDEFIPVQADLVFFYDHIVYNHPDGPSGPLNEERQINFIGPGSITVDETGIFVYRQGTDGIWNTGAMQSSYQDLWDMGILKAHGLSGQMGDVPNGGGGVTARQPANFSDFFTVTGTPGTDNYRLTSNATPIDTVEWVGGASGQWNDANAWRNTRTNVTGNANTLMGQMNGSDGMNDINPANTRARNIVIGGGAMVEYNAEALDSDFRVNQGSTLTIKEGATWMQTTNTTYTENRWTRFDPSKLILDGGTFKRTGEAIMATSGNNEGGGLLMMSTFSDDNNMARVGPPRIEVEIKNGGRLENVGSVWFGADDEHSPDTRVSWSINGGTVDLSGGDTFPLTNSTLDVEADLAFFYDYSEALIRPKNEEYEINFTGPGSITVDSAGIWVYRQDEDSIWNIGEAGPVSYQELWDMGILKANGLSGKMGVTWGDNMDTPITLQPADFNTFFSVTGMPGMDNYILTSLIEGATVVGVTGDFNNNGVVDAADYVLWRNGGPLQNDPTTGVQAEDYNVWRANFGKTAGPGAALSAAVPEPAAGLMLLMGMLLPFSLRRLRPVI